MDYQTAITNAKNGTPVRRTSWETGKKINLIHDSNGDMIGTLKTIQAKVPYVATQDDMFANDWTTTT